MTNYEFGDVTIKDITLSNKNTGAEINPSYQISSIDIYDPEEIVRSMTLFVSNT